MDQDQGERTKGAQAQARYRERHRQQVYQWHRENPRFSIPKILYEAIEKQAKLRHLKTPVFIRQMLWNIEEDNLYYAVSEADTEYGIKPKDCFKPRGA